MFKLSPSGSGWVLTTIYEFQGVTDGAEPNARVVFELTPSSDGWTEKVLYSFTGDNDGDTLQTQASFSISKVICTALPTTREIYLYGTVFQLTPSGSGWTENTVHLSQLHRRRRKAW